MDNKISIEIRNEKKKSNSPLKSENPNCSKTIRE
jgi:hypothetical protein